MVVHIPVKDIVIMASNKSELQASLNFVDKAQLKRAIYNMIGPLTGPEFVKMVEEGFNEQFKDDTYEFKLVKKDAPDDSSSI